MSAVVAVDTKRIERSIICSANERDDPPPAAVSAPTLVVKNKGLLTAAIMLAMVMQVLDTTIANVALPHMRAALSASQDEVSWVLTSYIVAAAIATPLSGWLADRLGRRNLLLIGVVRLHRRVAALRHRHEPARDGALPHRAGPLRRNARAARPGDHARHQPAREDRPGHGHLRHGHHGRRRSSARRWAASSPRISAGAGCSSSTCRSASSPSRRCSSTCRRSRSRSGGSTSSASPCWRSPSPRRR